MDFCAAPSRSSFDGGYDRFVTSSVVDNVSVDESYNDKKQSLESKIKVKEI